MTDKLLSHVRANAVAYAALFVALSGTAVAASNLGKNSVGTAQLKKGSVTPAKVKRNSLTGRQINESKLGQVPRAARAGDADRLDGKASGAFLGAGAKAADSERLDGIDSAVFGNTQTIAGINFEPGGATTKALEGTGSIACVGASNDFTERLQLPQGALIASLDFRFVDDDGVANSGLTLRAYDSFGIGGLTTVEIAQAISNGDNNQRRTSTDVLATPHAVDNAHYSYQLNWSPTICSSDMQLVGAAVHYTMPTG